MYTSKCILQAQVDSVIVTAKQPRLQTSVVLKKVQHVWSVTVTLRGKPVAKLVSLKKEKPRPLAEYPAFGMWAHWEDTKDVHAWLQKIRTPRYLR